MAELNVTETHTCTCGHHAEEPVLDARTIPHAVRHAAIFGALGGLSSGASMVLVAPHNPLPLLAQLEERDPGAFTREYVEQGPEAWKIRFTRV